MGSRIGHWNECTTVHVPVQKKKRNGVRIERDERRNKRGKQTLRPWHTVTLSPLFETRPLIVRLAPDHTCDEERLRNTRCRGAGSAAAVDVDGNEVDEAL